MRRSSGMAKSKGKITLKSTKSTAGSVMKELRRINKDADIQGCSGIGNNKNKRRR